MTRQPKPSLTGNFTLDLKQRGLCSSPLCLQTLGPWFTNEMLNVLSSEKKTLEHWATVIFLFSPGKMLLTMFLFQKCLGSSFPEDVWAVDALTPASVHSLWSSAKCLNRLCSTVFSSLRSALLLVHIFHPISSFQSTSHLICFDTALLEQPPPPPPPPFQ